MVVHYRTGHNAAMRLIAFLCCLLALPPAHAWGAAGHRLVARLAWDHLSAPARMHIAALLATHPDHPAWQAAAQTDADWGVFCEAATWADDIKRDPRFYDNEAGESPTPPRPGLADTARHRSWHYEDLDAGGRIVAGQLTRQLARLEDELAGPQPTAVALAWYLHLLGDIHQPLHVGRHGDEGGNAVAVESPQAPRQRITSLHRYWDDLPGPPWLRSERLDARAAALRDTYPPPAQGDIRQWREESHARLAHAYPSARSEAGLPLIDDAFYLASRTLAGHALSDAAYRLAWRLERWFGAGAPRETASGR